MNIETRLEWMYQAWSQEEKLSKEKFIEMVSREFGWSFSEAHTRTQHLFEQFLTEDER